jgi:uncharacterized tellurite resistance protein B-like protein
MYSPLNLIKNLLSNDTKIFDQENNIVAIKDALAILICHVIIADGIVTKQERAKIFSFFKLEFQMKQEATEELFTSILDNMNEFEEHLDILTQAVKNSVHTRAEILRHLNNIIICDGCKDSEYDIFNKILKSL